MPENIKETLDKRVGDSNKEAVDIMKMIEMLKSGVPVSFRNVDDSYHKDFKAYQPISKDATPEVWRNTIASIQQELNELLREDNGRRLAFLEVFRELTKAFEVMFECYETLNTGYDIQGRALVALCRLGGVSFDELIEMYTNNPTEDTVEEVSEVKGSMPF